MKPQFCNHRSPQGYACALYTGHYGPHKSTNLNYQWTDEDESDE